MIYTQLLRNAFRATLFTTVLIAPNISLSAEQCSDVLLDKKSGITFAPRLQPHPGSDKPLSLRLVDADNKKTEDRINTIGNSLLGKMGNIKALYPVIEALAADKSDAPYFNKLTRAFRTKPLFDREYAKKIIPKEGGAVVMLNHPTSGVDAALVGDVISEFRKDVKIVMTFALQEIPGMTENAFFLNPYGGPEAKIHNDKVADEMAAYVRDGGILVIIPSGDNSVKTAGTSSIPADLPWRPKGTMKILRAAPNAKVINAFVGGEGSPLFYLAKNLNLSLVASALNLRNIGGAMDKELPVRFAPPLNASDLLAEFGESQNGSYQLMQYLRARTFMLAENQRSAPIKSELITEVDPSILFDEAKSSGHELAFKNRGLVNILVDGRNMSETLLEQLGRKREQVFSAIGEGTGKSKDIDQFDKYYQHLLNFNDKDRLLLGAYRFGQVDRIVTKLGPRGLYTSTQYNHDPLVKYYGKRMLELGRSFVDKTQGTSALRSLKMLWAGIAEYMFENPRYRYLTGSVSISNAHSISSKYIMLKWLEINKMDPSFVGLATGKRKVNLKPQFQSELDIVVAHIKDFAELNRVVYAIDGVPMPTLFDSYDKLGAKVLAFDFDKSFNTFDVLVLVDVLSPEAEAEARINFGDNWESYRQKAQDWNKDPLGYELPSH